MAKPKCVCVCDMSVSACSNQRTGYKFEKEVWWTEKSWGGGDIYGQNAL